MTFDNDDFLRGRKEIMSYLKIKSWKTIKKYRKLGMLPIMRWVNGRPIALKSELIFFVRRFNELMEKESKKEQK